MVYGRLGKPEPGPSSGGDTNPTVKRSKAKTLLVIAAILTVAIAVALTVAVVVQQSKANSGTGNRRPSQAISRTCKRTQYPSLCINSLLEFPGAATATDVDLVKISVNMTLQKVGRALNFASELSYVDMDRHVRSAHTDCLEVLDDSVDLLSRSLNDDVSKADVLTWLSAAMTNLDTCGEGFDELKGHVKKKMSQRLQDLSELVSNSLAIHAESYSGGDDFSAVPIQNRRLLREGKEEVSDFPAWVSRSDRMLLDVPASEITADVTVSADGGGGSVKTIGEAIKMAPEHSERRFIIYVRAGRYEEDNLKLGRKKTNIMLIGDGKGKTVITGGKNVQDKVTTFHTASFAATGTGFIARDITFQNWAGPSKHQAVALRIGADHSVVYRCSIEGYQDTLYTHSQRQFYRDCDIYGTVDFIFGNAAVVLQKCDIHSRKPMESQKNTITAQNRKDPNQNTGISIHDCRIVAEPDLEAAKGDFPTYLGRPWKKYARTVYMLSYLGDHVDPKGWLEWSGSFALDTLYYGEYLNYGPGAGLEQRVKWDGYRQITSAPEAGKFTVAEFIYGSSWLPSTGVAFMAGLQS